ncbi:MAG TPA: peptide-methionine (S)-S-oxide reductase MsrA [Burkholderiaceae bacterium]|nr:peptide-methionine (S)-S-oxide reductase MsrA [Burkholderiaceae bacterium]
MSETDRARQETIYLAGGCFWCLEAVYDRVEGVLDVESGYANGHLARPSYEAVCTGETGHAEVVRVVFDPARIGLRELLEIFFVIHDPTTLNRQGNDVGTQYRSGIYWVDPQQAQVAREVIEQLRASGAVQAPVVTEVEPLRQYWPAEDYHQNYFERHPYQGYCAYVVAPKVEKFRQTFADRLRQA